VLLNSVLAVFAVSIIGGISFRIYRAAQTETAQDHDAETDHAPHEEHEEAAVHLSPQACRNLGLTAEPLQVTTYWRKIDLPGVITDRPGVSDRGVVAPVTGIVTQIHAYPGDTVAPNAPLFSLRLVSESLHNSQLELFKAAREIDIAREHKQRLGGLAQSGGVAGSRIIEIDNQIQRMEVQVQAYRQDLLARGLPPDRIDAAAQGEFVTEIVVRAPGEQALQLAEIALASAIEEEPRPLAFSFELQTLKVELGQQVDAGQVLCYLADHRALQIEGRGFKKDMALIQRAAQGSLPVEVTFEVSEGTDWPPLPRELQIHHVANLIDTQSRSFAFYLLLENQWRAYTQDGQDRMIWRFRPGDRVRLSVAVEQIDDVYVLPRAALVREGPEAYVFRQDGDHFDRFPVHVRYEDGTAAVIANDGDLRPGFYIAQNAAASLNRVLKAQLSGGAGAEAHDHHHEHEH